MMFIIKPPPSPIRRAPVCAGSTIMKRLRLWVGRATLRPFPNRDDSAMTTTPQTPRPWRFTTRKIVMSGDLNHAQTLFGGRVLEWVDQEAAIFAICQLNYPKRLVTKAISAIEFTAPAELGDVVEIGLRTAAVGTTSISLEVLVRNKQTKAPILHVDKIVFVNLGADKRPTPHGVTWDDLGRSDAELDPA